MDINWQDIGTRLHATIEGRSLYIDDIPVLVKNKKQIYDLDGRIYDLFVGFPSEIQQWIEENEVWIQMYELMSEEGNGLIFFKSREEAMRFKLVWGGR